MSCSWMANKSARDSEDLERLANWENEGGASSHPNRERPEDDRNDGVTASRDGKKSIVDRSGSNDGRSQTRVSFRKLPARSRS